MNQEKKVYRDWSDTETLIKCDNEECGGYSLEHELEENEWKCPHCGKPCYTSYSLSFQGLFFRSRWGL
jgi:hypothetical protein